MANTCDACNKELDSSGSIVFTPTETNAKEKHLCISCFEKLSETEKSDKE